MVVMIYVAEDISFVCRLAQVLDEMRAKSWSSLNVTAHERATEDQTDMLQNPGSIGRSESQRGGCLVLNEVVARPTTELTALQHCWLMTRL